MVTLSGDIQKTVSPVDGRVYVERELATHAQINEMFSAHRARLERDLLRLGRDLAIQRGALLH